MGKLNDLFARLSNEFMLERERTYLRSEIGKCFADVSNNYWSRSNNKECKRRYKIFSRRSKSKVVTSHIFRRYKKGIVWKYHVDHLKLLHETSA